MEFSWKCVNDACNEKHEEEVFIVVRYEEKVVSDNNTVGI